MTYKIVVVGGGTAGVMAATYFKAYWGDQVDVTAIYDHSKPGIGVGESLTPMFDSYLRRVGVSTIDVIKNCHATIKLGLKFKNWTTEGHWAYHNFPFNPAAESVDATTFMYNAVDAYDVLHNQYDGAYGYGDFHYENNLIPSHDNTIFRHALHLDANLIGRYIEDKFKDSIRFLDGIIQDVIVENNNIKEIVLTSGEKFTADLFIDCTGLARVLMTKLGAEWIDRTDLLPTDRNIPNPVFKTYEHIPPYTTAEATKNGWILDVPLSNRRGCGYTYSSRFTTDEEAREDFNAWLLKTHGVPLTSDRIIKFSSGYLKDPWIGNCVAIGLSSGFIEPLEATSLHHVIVTTARMVKQNCLTNQQWDRDNFNKLSGEMYENAYEYIRFFYHTGRTDSPFWQYMHDSTPDWLTSMTEKMKHSFLSEFDMVRKDVMFDSTSFVAVAAGHNIFTPEGCQRYLDTRAYYDQAKAAADKVREIKAAYYHEAVDHKQWIDYVRTQL